MSKEKTNVQKMIEDGKARVESAWHDEWKTANAMLLDFQVMNELNPVESADVKLLDGGGK